MQWCFMWLLERQCEEWSDEGNQDQDGDEKITDGTRTAQDGDGDGTCTAQDDNSARFQFQCHSKDTPLTIEERVAFEKETQGKSA